jgi:acetyltransferase-like isoleucine patch superfamily enzyme
MSIARYFRSLGRHGLRMVVMRLKIEMLRARYPDLVIGNNSVIRYDRREAFHSGRNVIIGPFCEIVAIQKTPLSSQPGRLSIGAGTVIGAFANIRAAGGTIEIGENGLIAQQVSIIAANHTVTPGAIYCRLPYDERRTGVRIGSNVWIGAGACLLPGCTVGDNSIIAAGAVVTEEVPPNEIWGGIPARRLTALADYREDHDLER